MRLRISPTSAHVRTVRLVTTAVARRTGLPDSVLDVIRLAVGEAGAQTGHTDPLEFLAGVDSAEQRDSDLMPSGLGMAVIDGLVDDLEIAPASSGPGTVVRMSWPLAAQV